MLRTEDVRAGLMQVDAVILEHNTEYILFSLRVPKAALRRNHKLLAAISDHLCEGKRPRPGALEPGAKPVRRPWWGSLVSKPALAVASLALVLGALVPSVQSVVASQKFPIELTDISAQPKVKLGDMLGITTTSRRVQVCMTTIDRLVLQRQNQQLVAHERLPAMWQSASLEPITRSYKVTLPTGVKPGTYLYRAWVHSECPDGESYHQQWPDVPFEVTE